MQAFYLARTGRPGPVLVDVPKDIQQQLDLPDWDAPMQISGYMSRLPPPPEPAQLAAVVKALKEAKKPVRGHLGMYLRSFLSPVPLCLAGCLQAIAVEAHMPSCLHMRCAQDGASVPSKACARDSWLLTWLN